MRGGIRGATSDFRPWSDEDKAQVVARYLAEGAQALAVPLGRTWQAVYRMASRLGLRRKRPWSREDVQRLRRLWQEPLSLEVIAQRLGRTAKTTYCKAYEMGLPLGVPEGYEYVSVAADRSGYDTSQLWVILSAAGVPTYPVRGRPTSRRRRYHYVDPFDVDEAVAAWLTLETVQSAARRHGVNGQNLRRWLVDAGHKPPERKHPWRLAPSVVDAVVTHRQCHVSLRTACARLGVNRARLSQALHSAGVTRGAGKLWLVTLDDCRRAMEQPALLTGAA